MPVSVTPVVLTISDFLSWSRIGRTRAYEEIGGGRLKSFMVGRRRYIRVADAEAWLAYQMRPSA